MTAFIISNLSSNLDRLNKPFNPLQGETFELQRDDYCVVCEQVLTCLSVHCTFENDTFTHLYIYQKITSRLVIGEISSGTHVTSHNWKHPLVLRQSLQTVCSWVETSTLYNLILATFIYFGNLAKSIFQYTFEDQPCLYFLLPSVSFIGVPYPKIFVLQSSLPTVSGFGCTMTGKGFGWKCLGVYVWFPQLSVLNFFKISDSFQFFPNRQ